MANETKSGSEIAARVPGATQPHFMILLAKTKVRDPKWEPFHFKAVGNEESGGVLMIGAEPRIITRGPRKGHQTWKHIKKVDEIEAFVANSEIRAARIAYEAETGNCHNCGGGGRQWAGWDHIEGTRYDTCSRCNGTGAAPARAEQSS